MADRQVTITISAKDNFSQTMGKYKNSVKQAGDQTKKAGASAKKAQRSFTDMGNVMQGVFGAAIIKQFVDVVGNLNEMGIEADRADRVFQNLSKSVGGYESAMASLRQVTNGVIDDTSLQLTANKLLSGGLVETQDELEKTIGLAVKLGTAMGKDAKTSISDFTTLMASQSTRQLTAFGLSISNVRTEVELLKKEGVDAVEAFNIALFNDAKRATDALGDSVNISATAFDKLGTRIENAISALSVFISKSLETGSQIIEIGFALSEAGEQGKDPFQILRNAFEFERRTNIIRNQQRIEARNLQRRNEMGLDFAEFTSTIGIPFTPQTDFGAGTGTLSIDLEATQFNRELRRLNFELKSLRDEMQFRDVGRAIAVFAEQSRVAQEQLQFDLSFSGFAGLEFPFTQGFETGEGNLGLFDPQVIESTIQNFKTLESLADEIRDDPLINDEQVIILDGIVERMGSVADEAERAKETLDKISLDSLLGKEGGGQLGQLGDLIAATIEDEDVSQAFIRAFNLETGRETELSRALEEEFAPLLGQVFEQFGKDISIESSKALLAAVISAQTMGESDAQVIAAGRVAIGFAPGVGGGAGGQITVRPGDTPSGLAAQTGFSIEEIFASAGREGSPFIFPGTFDIGGGRGGLVTTNIPPSDDRIFEAQAISKTQNLVDSVVLPLGESFSGLETLITTFVDGLEPTNVINSLEGLTDAFTIARIVFAAGGEGTPPPLGEVTNDPPPIFEQFETFTGSIEELAEDAMTAITTLSETEIDLNTSPAEDTLMDLETFLMDLSKSVFEATVKIKIDDKELVKLGLTGSDISVRNNGGSVDGFDERTGPRPRTG